ncbi:cupredoxin domain-containing protein [Skermania sp. ID1734]|nr:cupredoxin domain-containing protein [Skermania sp. ID1734]
MSASHANSGVSAGPEIVISSYTFSQPATVQAGRTLTVVNQDQVAHTVTADSGNAFNVVVGPGQEDTFTAPARPGRYPFHCTYHSRMHGELIVS